MAVARHAFEEAGFRRVLVGTEEANAASMRLIERLGAEPLGNVVPALPEVLYSELRRGPPPETGADGAP